LAFVCAFLTDDQRAMNGKISIAIALSPFAIEANVQYSLQIAGLKR
jgi:hypothetical protein